MSKDFKSVSMIGLGYIGLPTAAVIASHGIDVIGVDINQHVVDVINEGRIHIVEPDLDNLVQRVVFAGKFRATAKPEAADAFLIAVPTPFVGDHTPDLSYVEAAARLIASVLKRGDLVILESTSPVGCTEQLSQWLAELRPDLTFPHRSGETSDISVAYCPERVLPGNVIQELIKNDRVIGGITPNCARRASELYKKFVHGECVITNARTAEMCKLTENSFRDVNIAFANELSLICDQLNIDVWELIELANHHPRVNILEPGPGVGGHCIAVDPWFIVDRSPETARLIRTAREVNDNKPNHVIDKVKVAAAKLINPKIACLGLSFKADVDDIRESPSMKIVHLLKELGVGQLLVVEPHLKDLPEDLIGSNVDFLGVAEAIAKADIVLLLVSHQVFNKINVKDLDGKVVVDTRGLWQVH